MSYSIVPLPDLTVADGDTDSESLQASLAYADAELIGIIAPSNGGAGDLEVSHDGTTWVPFADLPAASVALSYQVPFAFLRISTDAAVTGDAVYKLFKRILTT